LDCGDGDVVGAGTATARGGRGVGLSDTTGDSSKRGFGVFSGLDVSSSVAALALAAFLRSGGASFSRDFFFAVFGFRDGLADFFDFREVAIGSGVSLGFGFGVVSSSPDSFVRFGFAARCGDSCGLRDAAVSLVDSSAAGIALSIGLGNSFAVAEAPVLAAFSFASLAFGVGLDDSSGVGEPRRFFFDLLAAVLAFATGLGDFSGVGDETARLSCCSSRDSSRWLSSSLTCARRTLPTITPSASAVASQRRKRTTAAERSRARRTINPRTFTTMNR
jgi:hypothetical protein